MSIPKIQKKIKSLSYLAYYQNILEIYYPSIYLINALPSKIVFSDVAAAVGIALTVSFLATLYPAWRAGKMLPAEALRYDH